MKCTTEPDGCQRCLARRIDCYYPESSANSRSGNTSSVPADAAEMEAISWTEETSSTVAGDHLNLGYSFLDQTDLDLLNATLACRPTYSESMAFETVEPHSFSAAEDSGMLTGTVAHTELDLDFELLTSPVRRTAQEPSEDLCVEGNEILPRSSETQISRSENRIPNEPPAICTCFAWAIEAYEMIGIQLIGGLQNVSTSAYQILQHQKMALMRCEDFLKCQECCSRSDFLMLVISMCDRMMSSLQSVLSQSHGRRKDHQETFGDIRLPLGVHNNTSGSTGTNEDLSQERQRLRIGRWELDDEDETHVLHSLLGSRLSKLSYFVDEIGRLVDKNHWPAHKDIIRELQERSQAARASLN